MKTPLIYELNNKYFDMNKLEHISDLQEWKDIFHKEVPFEYWFTYQVNGVVYSSSYNTDKGIISREREKLLNAWIHYKEIL